MRRILAGLALALSIAAPVAAASPTIDVSAGPYHFGDVLSVVIHGDVPGRPGEPKPKTHLRLDCQWSAGVYTEFVYSPVSETPIALHLGLVPLGITNWEVGGGGPADCAVTLYSVKYVRGWYTVDVLFDMVAFHVEG